MAENTPPGRRRWRGWSRGEALIVVAGAFLVADLLLLPWHHYFVDVDTAGIGIELPTFSLNRTGVQTPDSNLGIAALVLTTAMVFQVIVAKVHPRIRMWPTFHLVIGPAALGLLVAKLLADDSFLGAGAGLGIALGVGVAVGGYVVSQEAPAETKGVGSAR